MAKTSASASVSPRLDELISEREFQRRVDKSERTIRNWRESGKGPPYLRFAGRTIFYRLADVLAWEEACRKPHRAAERAASSGASGRLAEEQHPEQSGVGHIPESPGEGAS